MNILKYYLFVQRKLKKPKYDIFYIIKILYFFKNY